MTKNLLVSVIIPTIDGREKLLNRAVKSVKKQTYENIELIIVNEGCLGNIQRNIGINRANGKYIAFLDDDDEWLPDKIKLQVEIMEKYSYVPLVTTYIDDRRYKKYIKKSPYMVTLNYILNKFTYNSTSSYMIRKSAIDKIGNFDENLVSAQEYELAIRLLSNKEIAICIPKVLVIQHESDDSISKNWKKRRIGISSVYKKHKEKFINSSMFNIIKIRIICLIYRLGIGDLLIRLYNKKI